MEFHTESLASWETNSVFWDEGIGANGNKYWSRLQEPSLRRMFKDHIQGARALDLATGNGLTARWLVNNGCASVLATDGTMAMLERAKLRASTEEEKTRIEYRQLDVTDPFAFTQLLGEPPFASGFDIVLINMAIMDIANIEPLAEALSRLLKPDGLFVGTVLHPVFFTSRATRTIEVSDFYPNVMDKPEVTRGKVIREYLHIPPFRGVAIYGQPTQQVYFHRPIHELVSIFFKSGLVMDAMEEPAFTEEDGDKERIESNSRFTQLPAILTFRMRRRV